MHTAKMQQSKYGCRFGAKLGGSATSYHKCRSVSILHGLTDAKYVIQEGPKGFTGVLEHGSDLSMVSPIEM